MLANMAAGNFAAFHDRDKKMKKKMGAVWAGLLLAMPLAASAQGAYVGIGAVQAKYKLESEDYSGKDSVSSAKLYGGYQFDTRFGLEAGYVDHGKARGSFISYGDTVDFRVKARSFYLAATGNLPVNEQFLLLAKLGVAFNRVKDSGTVNGVDTIPVSYNRTTSLIGVGAAYAFTPNWMAVVEYENFGKIFKEEGAQAKAHAFSVGIRYRF